MHDELGGVRARVARVVRERLVPAVHRDHHPLTVTAWVTPGEPVPFAEAASQRFAPVAVGSAWGRPWGTVWFTMLKFRSMVVGAVRRRANLTAQEGAGPLFKMRSDPD